MELSNSELILNKEGGIYHLDLLPGDISDTIITVGDPDRVRQVSQYFDTIEVNRGKREFLTRTGFLNGKRITVISTGIGTDNVDIVLNELDALVNIDFEHRKTKKNRIRLNLVRIGTSGTIQSDIAVDSWIISEYAIGLDGLLHFYDRESSPYAGISQNFREYLDLDKTGITPYTVKCNEDLGKRFLNNRIRFGITLTNTGFYGPQGRQLRLRPKISNFIPKLSSFSVDGKRITNLEMETAGIYGLAQMLGHRAVSLSAILANRITGEFSKNPAETMDGLIQFALEKLTADP